MLPYHFWRNKYINDIKNIQSNKTILLKYKIFEILYALKLNLILWEDISPDIVKKYNIPHRCDYGVDLVSINYDKCVQVKLYEKSRITWKHFCTFRTYSKDILEIDNMILATCKNVKLDKLAKIKLIDSGKIKLIENNYDDLMYEMCQLKIVDLIQPKSGIIEKRLYLLDCYNLLQNSTNDIINFQLPCGTGKTYIMLYMIIMDIKDNDKCIIFCPWVDLAKQTLKLCKNMKLNVCFIGDGNNTIDNSKIVICVNPSVVHIPDVKFKYKFIDEAHHLENEDSKIKQKINLIQCDKELNFSATFKDDSKLDYKLSMRDAINGQFISDYVLNIEYFTSGDKTKSLIKLIKEKYNWCPMFIYFNTTERCIKFSQLLRDEDMNANYLIGKDTAIKRRSIRRKLDINDLKILCLCGVYNEGISFNKLRSVMFADLRHSRINKIQIAMRANRIHETKPFYRIILPVVANDFSEKDIKDLIKTFSDIDPEIKKSIKNKNNMGRVRINIENQSQLEDAELLYEKVYDSIGNMIPLSIEDKVVELLLFVEENDCIPTRKIKFSNDSSMGMFWMKCKNCGRISDKPYDKLLINDLLNKNYEEYLKIREINNNKIKLSIEEKVNELLLFVEKNNMIPTRNNYKFSDKCDMGGFWTDCKVKHRLNKELYNKLLTNNLLNKNYKDYLIIKEKTKNKIKLSIEEKINELLKFVDKNNIIPLQKIHKFSDKCDMGSWWMYCRQKNGLDKEPYDKLLTNALLKQDYEKYLINKEKNKINLSIKDKVSELIEFVEENGFTPPQKKYKFSNNSNMGGFWQDCKTTGRIVKEPYNKLLTNDLLKKNYEKYLIVKNKNKINLSIEDKIDELLQFVEKNNITPIEKKHKFSNGSDMGMFWGYCKQKGKLNIKPYNKLLINDLLNKNYEEYLKIREINNNKIKLSIEDKVNELIIFVEKNNKIPSKSVKFSNDSTMSEFWTKCKIRNKLNKESYIKLLTNNLLNKNYEDYLKIKENNNNKSDLSIKEKIGELILFIKKNNKIPIKNVKFSNGSNMGGFWQHCKQRYKLDKEPYIKLLANDLLNKNYKDYLKIKENNKNKVKLSIKDKINELLKFVEENDIIPPQRSYKFSNDSDMGFWWTDCKSKNKLSKEPYNKLLTNSLLQQSYEKYLFKKINN
jgi:superfamily II DNA or RNA helicase